MQVLKRSADLLVFSLEGFLEAMLGELTEWS